MQLDAKLIDGLLWLLFSLAIAITYLLSFLFYDKIPIFKKIGNFILLLAFVNQNKRHLLTFAIGMFVIVLLLAINVLTLLFS